MKMKHLLWASLLGLSLSAHALKGDTEQPMNIESDAQSLDMQNNVVTLTGNVAVSQGSIRISAAKVVVTRPAGKSGREVVDAYGSPVKFSQQLDNGKPVNGQGNHVHYELGTEFLTLNGNAQLKQLDSFISGSTITYDVKKQQLKANSGGGKSRVKTVLIPTQLQNNQ